VTQAVADHQQLALARGLELTFSPDDEVLTVCGDLDQLEQVVTNLLLNAINYSLSGAVRVSTHQVTDNDQVRIVVEDTGIGLDTEELNHCFERFYRGKRIGQYNITPGVGLGLSTVKQIVEFHNGRVEVESEVNQGSTSTVYLPT
jgi:two-component system phosphate regulon sensor histidine kinase PhoR